MSLHFIIDGYNVINHPLFSQNRNKKIEDTRAALVELIEARKLCGSKNNKTTIVFDGYFDLSDIKRNLSGIEVVLSMDETADAKINRMIEHSPNPKNSVVVSDDKDIKFFIRSCGAKSMSVEEFMGSFSKLQNKGGNKEKDLVKTDLNYSQIAKINEELRKLWLE